jgi:phosphomannomutase
VIKLVSEILDIQSIRGKKIIIWPYLGKARGIVDLFKYYGANVILVDEEINPPNPIKELRETKLRNIMDSEKSNIAILLDADRDRIALYVKQKEKYFFYIPNEIYSAMHNILANEFKKKIINVRTIPSDLRGDKTSLVNILTGVGYKHLGIILYFLLDIEVDQSKVNSAILYLEDINKDLIKIKDSVTLRKKIISIINQKNIEDKDLLIVMWEESGGHTLNILEYLDEDFKIKFPIIADKYPVPALVLAAELVARGFLISESIDWSIKGINRTIHAEDEQKIKIMNNFEENDGKDIIINSKKYHIDALSDNNGEVDIFRLKSDDSTLYFRPSGTGPDVRFYIFGDVKTHLDEIKKVQNFVQKNYS